MVWLVRLLIGLGALTLLGMLAGQIGLLRGRAPEDLGVCDGKLKAPSRKPNSVSSQADLWPGHPQQAYARIAPLPAGPDGATTLARLHKLLADWPGARVVKAEGDYLYAEFTTPLMKYTDDTEFWLDRSAGVLHVRSASRLGRSDLQANRKRVEALRAALAG